MISVINAVTFLAATIFKIEALKQIATNIAYPIIRLSTVLVVIFGVIFFNERLTFFQGLGIILSLAVIVLVAGQNKNNKNKDINFRRGLTLTLFALVAGAAATTAVKFAAVGVNLLGFMFVSYTLNTFFSFMIRNKLQTDREDSSQKNALILGLAIGIANFIGFFVLLKAYTVGPLSIIAPIISLSFVFVIILSAVIYKERLDTQRVIGIILAIFAIILMKL